MTILLLTGISGTGKSTLTQALNDKDVKAIDLDTPEWSMWTKDIQTPIELGPPVKEDSDWIWDEIKVKNLLNSHKNEHLILSGCAENMGEFLPYFDRIIVLTVSTDVLTHRLQNRTTNQYGKDSLELERILKQKETIEPLLKTLSDIELDTDRQLESLIQRILSYI